MSGCLDRISCECCECCQCENLKEWIAPKRNMMASILAGTLFALGWWCVIDSTAEYSEPVYGAYFICGIFSTIALLMINSISTGQIMGDTYTEGLLGRRAARAWLFVGFLFAFGGLIGSLWIFIQQFLVPAVENADHSSSTHSSSADNNVTVSPFPSPSPSPSPAINNGSDYHMQIWQGISFFLQNLFIFFSTLIFKFGRTEEDNSW